MDLHTTDDVVTLVLLGSIALLTVLPGILLLVWRVTRPPFRIASFRWLYLAWACLLVASMVWNFSRTPRYSVGEAGADNYVRLGFLALGVLVILAVGARYRFNFFSELGRGPLGIFFLFSLWGLASTLWSVFPAGTLVKSAEYCAMLGLIALAGSLLSLTVKGTRNRALALKSVFDFGWVLIFLLIVSVYLGILIWPELAIVRAWRDVSGVVGFSIEGVMPGINGNAVGQLGAMLGVMAVVRILLKPTSRLFYVPIFMLSLVTMVLTQSRSPILAFSVAVVAILAVSRRFGLLALCGAFLGTGMLTQYGQGAYGLAYDFMRRGQSTENIASLTGRVEYWQASIEAVRERMFGGYGANAGGRYVLESVLGEERTTVHSTWVEVLLDTGVIGLVLLLGGVVATWFWLFRLRPLAMKNPVSWLLWLESLGLLTILSVRSMFSVDFVWSWEVLFFGVILVFINVTGRQVAQARYAGAHYTQPLPTARWRGSGIRG